MKKFYQLLLMLTIALFTFSCSYDTLVDFPAPEGDISFAVQVQPIFDKCTGCHGSLGGLDLKNNTYDNIMAGRVDLENPENSKIYTKPHPDGGHPTKYTNTEAETVLIWIQQGALNN